jgi:hypothetical protein
MQCTLADRPAMEPLVFDGNLHPRPATVSVANADTKPMDGHTPAPPANPCRDRTAKGRAAYLPQHARPPRLAVGQSVFDQYALYGLAGEAVRTLAPHTEAQPEAILLQLP